jgi:hypothetical protein
MGGIERMERHARVKIIADASVFLNETGVIETVGSKPTLELKDRLYKVKMSDGYSYWFMKHELEEVE